MSYLDADPSQPKEQILNDIRSAAQQSHMPGLPLLPFGALLVKVGGEASETIAELKNHITRLNDENSKLQRWVLVLAIAALISTVVQTAFGVLAYVYPPPSAQPTVAVAAPLSVVAPSPTASPKLADTPPAASQPMVKASDLSASAALPLPVRAPESTKK